MIAALNDLVERWMAWLEKPVLGNPLGTWLFSLIVIGTAFVVLRIVFGAVSRRLAALAEKKANKVLAFLGETVARTSKATLLVAAAVAGAQFVNLPGHLGALLRSILVVTALFQGGLWTTLLLEKWLQHKLAAQKDGARSTAVTLLSFGGKLVLWGFIVLMSLENLGVDVTALIAGLGVGGVALALATQTLLADILGSVVIAMDKPFEVGDLIIVGEMSGTVENIGLKTTRVRSIHGEQIVFSNTDLLSSRIRNHKRMSERRMTVQFAVANDTPVEKLERIPELARGVVSVLPDVRFERATYRDQAAFGPAWEVVFHVLSPDNRLHLDRQHDVNLALHKRLLEEQIKIGPI
jgi:small-conductance mechanosensitive channel